MPDRTKAQQPTSSSLYFTAKQQVSPLPISNSNHPARANDSRPNSTERRLSCDAGITAASPSSVAAPDPPLTSRESEKHRFLSYREQECLYAYPRLACAEMRRRVSGNERKQFWQEKSPKPRPLNKMANPDSEGLETELGQLGWLDTTVRI